MTLQAEHIDYQIATLLKHEREIARLSQTELAALASCTKQHISQLERGCNSPSVVTLDRIARALGKRVKVEFIEAE